MFSKATEYALRAVIYIAEKSAEDNKLGIRDIAKSIDSPRSFTAKILQSLTADNNIISSTRGPNGGFYITEKAKSLPVRAILEAMDEYAMLEKCVLGLRECSESKPCPMHAEYKTIKKQLLALFERKTIGDLVEDMKTGEVYINSRRKKTGKV